MDHLSTSLLLFVSLCHWMITELSDGIWVGMTWNTGIHIMLWPTVLSGALALLVKHLIALRVLPVYKLVSGSLLVVLSSWYIDRILNNNTFLLVRSVGIAILLCAGVGAVIVSGERLDGRHQAAGAETVVAVDYGVARD